MIISSNDDRVSTSTPPLVAGAARRCSQRQGRGEGRSSAWRVVRSDMHDAAGDKLLLMMQDASLGRQPGMLPARLIS